MYRFREVEMKVVGVDGCRGGWVAVCWDVGQASIQPRKHDSLADLIASYADADAIGVDIPIGLSSAGSRTCDMAARRVLGRGRSSSVFPAPHPDILHASTYQEAGEWSRARIQKGVSQQTFAIFDKIAEANSTITMELQDRVFEVHPEVSFWALAGASMIHPKDHLAGYLERKTWLEAALGVAIPDRTDAFKLARPAKPDDILDATVAAWTAKRVVDGVAGRLPAKPERDARGLRMEIVY
jgi:predicted RNase H-like nuclease